MFIITETSTSKTYFLKSCSDSLGGIFTLRREESKVYETKEDAHFDIYRHFKAMPKSCMNKLSVVNIY